jgi:hypothetical protein
MILASTATGVELENLTFGTEYLFTLQIINSSSNVYYSNTLDITTPMGLSEPTINSYVSINNGFTITLASTSNILSSSDTVEFILLQGSNLFYVVKPYSSSNVYTLSQTDNALIRNYMSYSVSCYFNPAANNANYTAASGMSNTILSVVPSDLPNPAQALSSSVVGNFQATLTWSQPTDFAYYSSSFSVLVGYSLDGVNFTTVNLGQNVNSTSYTFSGLTNNNYTFEVIYKNPYGPSTPTTTQLMVYGLPSQPTASTVIGDTQITLNWSAPNTNGSPILSYNVYLNGSLLTNVLSTVLTYNFTGLTNGVSYSVSVSALNILGEGPLITCQSLVPTGASSISNVVINGKQLTFTFTPNGTIFQNYYVLGMDSSPSVSNPPIVKNILPSSLAASYQSQITGSFNITVDFSANLQGTVQKYFVVASSQNNSSFIDNIGI